jgi:anti-sigma-K factor RskA
MRLARHRLLDAVCGEYLLGTLRGPARRRFERALRDEPQVDLRLRHWQALFTPRYSAMLEIQPFRGGWRRLERELELSSYRTSWYRRLGPWRAATAAAALAALLAVAVQLFEPGGRLPAASPIARLTDAAQAASVIAALGADGRTLELRPSRPVIAGPAQSYELWLLPRDGRAPVSLAVLGSLEARFELRAAHASLLREGGKLAVSVEPAGGSPTGAPTGPVILAGAISG